MSNTSSESSITYSSAWFSDRVQKDFADEIISLLTESRGKLLKERLTNENHVMFIDSLQNKITVFNMNGFTKTPHNGPLTHLNLFNTLCYASLHEDEEAVFMSLTILATQFFPDYCIFTLDDAKHLSPTPSIEGDNKAFIIGSATKPDVAFSFFPTDIPDSCTEPKLKSK